MRKSLTKILLGVVLAAVVTALVGCPPHVSIADINKDPGRYAGKEITISGSASNTFGAMGNGIYQMDDGTGHLWVYSQGYGIPGSGSKTAVTGRIEQGFNFGGRSFAVILRQTQNRH
jgi:hypothetical protein